MLVSVGVPVFNGADTLRRALDSLLAQTHTELEIVISDNASTDATEAICRGYRDSRVRYVRQPRNLGAAANYEAAKQLATGEYFMWLGDDDWLDPAYIERCGRVLATRDDVSLAVGRSCHYDGGQLVHTFQPASILDDDPRRRVVTYFHRLVSNTFFYGLMRKRDIDRLAIEPGIGTDLSIVAALAFVGKVVSLDDIAIHRDLGGTSRSQAQIARSNGMPVWKGRFHMFTAPVEAFRNVAWNYDVFREQTALSRVALATIVAAMTFHRRTKQTFGRQEGLLGRLIPSLRDARLREVRR